LYLFFFFALGSHLPMSRKLLGDYAALAGGSAESYKVVKKKKERKRTKM